MKQKEVLSEYKIFMAQKIFERAAEVPEFKLIHRSDTKVITRNVLSFELVRLRWVTELVPSKENADFIISMSAVFIMAFTEFRDKYQTKRIASAIADATRNYFGRMPQPMDRPTVAEKIVAAIPSRKR